MAEEVAAQKLPDVFDRVELWRIGWQRQQADIVWHWQTFAGLMPAGTVEHQHGVRARRNLRADFPKMLGHRLAVDRRHDDGGTNTAFRADGTKQIGGIMAVVAHSQWSAQSSSVSSTDAPPIIMSRIMVQRGPAAQVLSLLRAGRR
ncbi:hypothetical protein Apmu_0808_02 [Acidiphilium multivorum AIU301]|nr:hypothetical protein Apmu_0808_02 [Acidiphilium multivorum AIU301]